MLALSLHRKGVSAALVTALFGIAVILFGAWYFLSFRKTLGPVPESTQAAMVQAFSQKYSRPADTIQIEVTDDTGAFAKGSIRFADVQGGGVWFAAKTDAGWQLAFDGNGIIDCETAEAYQFPADMVPQCVDAANDSQLINRAKEMTNGGGNEPTLIGGQTDDHGCLIAAGYSWCAPKEKCLRIWEEGCYADLAQEIQYMLADKYDRPVEEVRVTLAKQMENHASGNVRFGPLTSSAGGQFLATKIDNVWQLVYDGNGSIECEALRRDYSFPDEILKPNFCD